MRSHTSQLFAGSARRLSPFFAGTPVWCEQHPMRSGGVRPALLQFLLGHCLFGGLASVPLRGQWEKHVTALLVKIPTVTVNPAEHSIQMLAPDVCLSALARASRTASHAL